MSDRPSDLDVAVSYIVTAAYSLPPRPSKHHDTSYLLERLAEMRLLVEQAQEMAMQGPHARYKPATPITLVAALRAAKEYIESDGCARHEAILNIVNYAITQAEKKS